MIVGYARISTKDQNIDLQIDALKKAECERIFSDIGVSGTKAERPEFNKLMLDGVLREGDTLIVWKMDRIFRSLKHMIQLVNDLKEKKVEFKSIQDSIDTSTPGGRLVFHIMASIAEFESDLIRERTKAGLEAARARGRKGGRKKKVSDTKFKVAVELYNKRDLTVKEICKEFKITTKTFYVRLNQLKEAESNV